MRIGTVEDLDRIKANYTLDPVGMDCDLKTGVTTFSYCEGGRVLAVWKLGVKPKMSEISIMAEGEG